MKDILDAANHYGFAPEEVNNSADHRVFMMAYDAVSEAPRLVERREGRTQKRPIASQPRVLRSKGTQAGVSKAQKRVKVLKSKASTTGKAEDVANFMAARRVARAPRT